MLMPCLSETIDLFAMAMWQCNGNVWTCVEKVGWLCLGKGIRVEVEGQMMKERPKMTQKKPVDEDSMEVGLNRRDILCRSKWIVGVNLLSWLRLIWPPSLVGDAS